MDMPSSALVTNMTIHYFKSHLQQTRISISSATAIMIHSIMFYLVKHLEVVIVMDEFCDSATSMKLQCADIDVGDYSSRTFLCPAAVPKKVHCITVWGLEEELAVNVSKLTINSFQISIVKFHS